MPSTIPRRDIRTFAGNFVRAMMSLDGVRDVSQILSGRRNVDVYDTLHLIVIQFRGCMDLPQFHHGIERSRLRKIRCAQRNISQIRKIVNGGLAILIILNSQVIIISGLTVNPIIRRDHDSSN